MSVVIHARVVEQLTRLRLRYVADRLDAVLNDAARTEPTYLDFLDGVCQQEGLDIIEFPDFVYIAGAQRSQERLQES